MDIEELDDLKHWVTIGYPMSNDERMFELENELISLADSTFDLNLDDLVVWEKGALGNDTTDVVGLTFSQEELEEFSDDYRSEVVDTLSEVIKNHNLKPLVLS